MNNKNWVNIQHYVYKSHFKWYHELSAKSLKAPLYLLQWTADGTGGLQKMQRMRVFIISQDLKLHLFSQFIAQNHLQL